MERLEHDADMAAAKARQAVLVEGAQVLAGNRHMAGIGPFKTGQRHQERRLAGPRRADQAHRLAGRDGKRDPLEDVHAGGAASEAEVDIFQHDGHMVVAVLALGLDPLLQPLIHAPPFEPSLKPPWPPVT